MLKRHQVKLSEKENEIKYQNNKFIVSSFHGESLVLLGRVSTPHFEVFTCARKVHVIKLHSPPIRIRDGIGSRE